MKRPSSSCQSYPGQVPTVPHIFLLRSPPDSVTRRPPHRPTARLHRAAIRPYQPDNPRLIALNRTPRTTRPVTSNRWGQEICAFSVAPMHPAWLAGLRHPSFIHRSGQVSPPKPPRARMTNPPPPPSPQHHPIRCGRGETTPSLCGSGSSIMLPGVACSTKPPPRQPQGKHLRDHPDQR